MKTGGGVLDDLNRWETLEDCSYVKRHMDPPGGLLISVVGCMLGYSY